MMRGLIPWRSLESFELLRRDMDTLFDRFFGDFEREFTPWLQSTGEYAPPIESYVDGNTLVVKVDLPGVDPKDVEILLEGNHLSIKGERKAAQERKEGNYFHRELSYGSFRRTLTLPEGVKTEEVHARYHDGVLEVTLPAPEAMVGRTVPIEVTSEAPKQLAA